MLEFKRKALARVTVMAPTLHWTEMVPGTEALINALGEEKVLVKVVKDVGVIGVDNVVGAGGVVELVILVIL